jgi:hypothetical protein
VGTLLRFIATHINPELAQIIPLLNTRGIAISELHSRRVAVFRHGGIQFERSGHSGQRLRSDARRVDCRSTQKTGASRHGLIPHRSGYFLAEVIAL